MFAKHGVDVLATDLEIEAATEQGWAKTHQHMSSRDILNKRGIASPADFAQRVRIMNVDMNHIPAEVKDFDFAWSTCALGHIGGLEQGLAFIENSLAVIKPGGLLVHTTELNLSSDTHTFESDGTVVYRKRDIQALVARLTAQGHEVKVNFNIGDKELDRHIDDPPYSNDKHLRLRLGSYAVTSLGLIVRKNPNATP
ncbi:MAG: class I SAM-dependent methyltransferase [Kofleriaceae bacterium]|nr:class I SAM-dependent methyltransferase [Kofleriaceae bacterium]